jgi:hypothetical protein
MPRVKKITRFVLVVLSLVGGAFALGAYLLFHGYFDHGKFEIKQEEWTSKKVAMLALRTDNEALGGYDAFVLIGDHLYSPVEIRHFIATPSCLLQRQTA